MKQTFHVQLERNYFAEYQEEFKTEEICIMLTVQLSVISEDFWEIRGNNTPNPLP